MSRFGRSPRLEAVADDFERVDDVIQRVNEIEDQMVAEKELRMESINEYYHRKQAHALDKWNGGEGYSTGSCKGKVGVTTSAMPALM